MANVFDKAKKKIAQNKGKGSKKAKAPTPIADSDIDVTKDIGEVIRDHLTKNNTTPEKKKAEEARHYFMWVGNDHYPMVDHFIEEARKMGVSKRLNMVTPHLVPGVTRVYLAHNRWYETSEGFLEASSFAKGKPSCAISRMKSLRKIGMAVQACERGGKDAEPWTHVKTSEPIDMSLDKLVTALDDRESPATVIVNTYVDDLFRLLGGPKADAVFCTLVTQRQAAVTVKGSGRPWFRYFGKGRAQRAIRKARMAAALDVARDYVRALDAGKAFFGYFVLECLEYILPKGKTLPGYLDSKTINTRGKDGKKRKDPTAQWLLALISESDGGRRSDKLPKVVRVIREEDEIELRGKIPRGCGFRKPGGVYAVSNKRAITDKGKAKAKGLGVAGPLYLATAPIQTPGMDYFRGIRAVPDEIADVLGLEMELGEVKKA